MHSESRVAKESDTTKNVLLFGLFRCGFPYARINSFRISRNPYSNIARLGGISPFHLTLMLSGLAMSCGLAGAGEVPGIGADTFPVSTEHPVGWRGDGSGRFPGANPPLVWHRALRSPLQDCFNVNVMPQDAKPGGQPLARLAGSNAGEWGISEWLVVGPVRTHGYWSVDDPFLFGEGGWYASPGDKLGDMTWKAVSNTEGKPIDLAALLGETPQGQAAYLMTYLYSPTGFSSLITSGAQDQSVRHYINGRSVVSWDRTRQRFSPGWNRIVVKVLAPRQLSPQEKQNGVKWLWNFEAHFKPCGRTSADDPAKNIAWSASLPGGGWGAPTVVGDRIFLECEPNDLACFDAAGGRLLWLHGNSLCDAISQGKDLKATVNLELLKPKAAEVIEQDRLYALDRRLIDNVKRVKLSSELSEAIRSGDPAYGGATQPESEGRNGACAPVSDGAQVWAWFAATGVLACYDLQGERKWITQQKPPWSGWRGACWPVLRGDRLIVTGPGAVLVFDAKTGACLARKQAPVQASVCALPVRVGDIDAVATADGFVFSGVDGTTLATGPAAADLFSIAPVLLDGNRYFGLSNKGAFTFAVPEQPGAASKVLATVPAEALANWRPAGPMVQHEGLAYVLGYSASDRKSSISVFDPPNGTMVYRQEVDLTIAQGLNAPGADQAPGLALAGSMLIAMDSYGASIVFEPGRTFKLIGCNVLETSGGDGRQELTLSPPAFSGRRIFLRTQENLFCIEEK